MICFGCQQPIADRQAFSRIYVKELDRSFEFHHDCARSVVAAFVLETLQREADLEQRAKEKNNPEALAERLGFQEQCARCEMLGGLHLLDCVELRGRKN